MSLLHSPRSDLRRRLHVALFVNAAIILGEFIGGWLINSVGLISDAGHNLVDQGSLFLAFYAHMLAQRPATDARTFGFHRAGVVTAFLNAFVLLLTAGGIALLGIHRLLEPVTVPGLWVIVIALLSFAANLGIAFLLHAGSEDDINIRGAFWHMLADAWVSLGVAASGVAIMFTGWTWTDPLVSLVIVGVIVKGAWPIFRESLDVLLESTPPGLSPSRIIDTLERIPGVKNVHDLHVWAVEPRMVMLTCHVLVDGDDALLTDALLRTIRTMVQATFGIKHMTIQLETRCCHPDVVLCDLNRITDAHQSLPESHPHPHRH
jgi:cobalt-zinc-cadmium efflux system protein